MTTDQVKLAGRVGRVGAAVSSEQGGGTPALGHSWPFRLNFLSSPPPHQATAPPVAWEQVRDGQMGFWGWEKQPPQKYVGTVLTPHHPAEK